MELISELVGSRDPRKYTIAFPRATAELSEGDWEIIHRVRLDPESPYIELAKEMDLSTKTVRKRMERLVEGRAVFFMPDINFRRLQGAMGVDVFLDYTDPGSKGRIEREIFSKYQDFILRAGFGSPSHGHFMMLVPSTVIAQEVSDFARGLDGVGAVKMHLIYDWVNLQEQATREALNAIRRKASGGLA